MKNTILTTATVLLITAPIAASNDHSILDTPAPRPLRPLAPEPHPFTTDPGRFVIELSPLVYTHSGRDPDESISRRDAFEPELFLKYGLLDNLDLQVGLAPYLWQRDKADAGADSETRRGFGDLTLRLKANLWGNDQGDTALSIMPYVVLPTSTGGVGERVVTGGAMLPFAWDFAEGWTVELTPGFAAVRNSDDTDHVFEFSNLMVLTRELADGVDVFVDFDSAVTSENGEPWTGTLGFGMTFELNEDTILEWVVGFGVTQASDDVTAAITVVRRF